MITESSIREAVGLHSFAAGEMSVQVGQVTDLTIEAPNRIEGQVQDERGAVFAQHIVIDDYSDAIQGNCTCRKSYNCEHVAAVLLDALPKLNVKEGSMPPAIDNGNGVGNGVPAVIDSPSKNEFLSDEVRNWFENLQTENRQPDPPRNGKVKSRAKAKKGNIRNVFYVFRSDTSERASIIPHLGRIKKNGMVGVNFKEWDYIDLGHKSVTYEDVSVLFRIRSLRSRHRGMERWDWPQSEALDAFLKDVVETGRAYSRTLDSLPLKWGEPSHVNFAWETTETGHQRIVIHDERGAVLRPLIFSDQFYYIDESLSVLGRIETDLPASIVKSMAAAPSISPADSGVVAEKLSSLAELAVPAPRVIEIQERKGLEMRPVLTLLSITLTGRNSFIGRNYGNVFDITGYDYPCVRLDIEYGDTQIQVKPGQGGDVEVMTDDGCVLIRRRLSEEQRFQEQLAEALGRYHVWSARTVDNLLGLSKEDFDKVDFVFLSEDMVMLPGDQRSLDFHTTNVPEFRRAGWRVDIDSSWPHELYEGPVEFSAGIESKGNDWFSLSMKFKAAGQEVDLIPVLLDFINDLDLDDSGQLIEGNDLKEIISRTTFRSMLGNGAYVVIEAERLEPFVHAFLETHGLCLDFHRAEAGRVAALSEALDGCGIPWQGGKELVELGQRLRTLEQEPQVSPPDSMQGMLRDYQRMGYGWLLALSSCGFGGTLADDMGLGKTVQALALLAYRHLDVGADRPSLLVVPTSLLGNWVREAQRFVPGLKVLKLHGPDRRERFPEIADHHLILTTYPLVNRDYGSLFSHQFELAILDEAQAVKNPTAAVTKRIRRIDARQKLALTGTPMENNLGELWSLYDWLIPGLLGDRKTFNSNWRQPIEKEGDIVKQRVLSQRLKPFLLRRTKEEVANELPPKTELNEVVPLSEGQRVLYESIRTLMDQRVRDAVQDKGIDRSRITILDALLKLRQVCCDPKLVKLEAAKKVAGSAKRERLLEMLEELVVSGRKILVYSQFVQMLRLIEQDVVAKGWDYAMLHGQTIRRDDEIAKFQDGNVPIFLVSLKAGGVGLNLTAADTVIIYDPWWNPALERQAMDRAHRIGQDKPVFVHRMIAEGSVEASIQEMQKRKQALADALFEGGGKSSMALTEEDIASLLAPID